MRTAATIILKQLANEGVRHDESFGLHWFVTARNDKANYLGADVDLRDAVRDAMKHSARITALLIKLDDALSEDGGTQ